MGFLGNAIKGGLAVKAAEIVRGQLQKRSGTAPVKGGSRRFGSRTVSGRPVRGRPVTGRPVRARKR